MPSEVPCVLSDDDAEIALRKLHEVGADERIVHGPGEVELPAGSGPGQRRALLAGMAIGPPIGVALTLVAPTLVFDHLALAAKADPILAGLGIAVGLVGGAFYGAMAGLFLSPDDGPTIHVEEDEVLVLARADDPEEVRSILEAHGARCYRPEAATL